jgi:phosphonatase-like hydrolase
MAIRMFVFDVAGTTVADFDNAVAGKLVEAIGAWGVDILPEEVNPLMGMPKPLAVRSLLKQVRGSAPADEEVVAIHADFQKRMIAHYLTSPSLYPIDGALELFADLRRRGIRITLDTGFDRPILNAILQRLGWDSQVIDDTVTSDEVPQGRPAPDMIEKLMQRAGIIDPSEVVKVGDSISDVEQGLAAGCGITLAVLSERTQDVSRVNPQVRVISHLSQIIPLLGAC